MTLDRYYGYDELKIQVAMGKLILNLMNLTFHPMVAGSRFPMHSHKTYELHFIAEGYGLLKTPETSYQLGPGTFYLTGPGVLHEQINDQAHPMLEFGINFDLRWSRKRTPKDSLVIDAEIDEIFQTLMETKFWYGEDKFDSCRLFEGIFAELQNRYVGYFLNVQNYLSQIIINTLRYYNNEKRAEYSLPQKTLDDKKYRILDAFFSQSQLPLTLASVAGQLGVSSRQAERIIRQYYGQSFSGKLMNSRLTVAKRLLVETGQSVEKTALQSGFSSLSYFSKCFKRLVGMSPRQYREQFRAASSG